MERLTERDMNCPYPKTIYGVYVKNHDYIAAAHRLADYEDTGLTPEEYKKALGKQFKSFTALRNKYVAMRNELCQYCGKYKQAHDGACDGCRWREM